jgi:hypothetical protein
MTRYNDLEIAVLVDRIHDAAHAKWGPSQVDDVLLELGHVLEILGEPEAALECREGTGMLTAAADSAEKLEELEGNISLLLEETDYETLEEFSAEIVDWYKLPGHWRTDDVQALIEVAEGLSLDEVVESLKDLRNGQPNQA